MSSNGSLLLANAMDGGSGGSLALSRRHTG